MSCSKLKPWETVVFPWGTAVRHRKGRYETIILRDGQEIDVSGYNVTLSDSGIHILFD